MRNKPHTIDPISGEIRAALARRGIKRVQLEEALGLSRGGVARRLTGETEFTASQVRVVAALAKTPISALFGETPVTPTLADGEG